MAADIEPTRPRRGLPVVPPGWLVRVSVAVMLATVTGHAVRPMISYRALENGASAAQVGLIAAAYGFLGLISAVPTGRLVDRLGGARFLLLGTTVATAASLALAFVQSLLGLALAQAALGLAQVFLAVGAQTIIAEGGPGSARDFRYGMFTSIVALGHIAGPAIAGYAAESSGGITAVFYVGAVIALGAVLIGSTLLVRPPTYRKPLQMSGRDQPSMRTAATEILRVPSVAQAILASLAVLATIDVLIAYFPAYGELVGISVGTVGALLAIRAAASVVVRLFMGWLILRVGRKVTLATSLVVPAVSLALVPLTDGRVPLLVLLMITTGLGLGIGQPMTVSWVAGRVPRRVRATALGMRLMGNRLGQLVVPALAGAVAGAAGVSGIFIALAVLLSGSGAMSFTATFADLDKDPDPVEETPD